MCSGPGGQTSVQPNKLNAVKSLRQPRHTHELRSVLSAMNYLRSHTHQYGPLAAPLLRLMNAKKLQHVWTALHTEHWKLLKAAVLNSEVLQPFVDAYKTQLITDASQWCVGGVL